MPRRERVTEVIDGDTFRTASRPKRSVRLADVKAPELNEPGGAAAKRKLESLIKGKEVIVAPVGSSYGRTVAKVTEGRRSVNKAMINQLK